MDLNVIRLRRQYIIVCHLHNDRFAIIFVLVEFCRTIVWYDVLVRQNNLLIHPIRRLVDLRRLERALHTFIFRSVKIVFLPNLELGWNDNVLADCILSVEAF